MRSKITFTLFVSSFCTFLLSGGETPSTALLVLSKGNHALMIVDPATLQVAGQAPSGPDPHEVIASADGRIAYISNYGSGAYNTITVVDLAGQKNLPIIDLGPLRGPHGLEFVGGKLWFTAEGAKAIGSYDPTAKKVDWILGTGQNRTHMIFVSSGLKRIFTSNVSSGTISIIEKTTRRPGGPGPGGPRAGGPPPPPRGPGQGGPPAADWNETVIRVGNGAEGFDVSPDGGEIWAANAQDGTISVIDVQSKKVIQTLDANVRSANRLKFTPDGTQVFVSMLGGPDLVVFDAASRKEVKRVKLGHGAAGILMDPDGRRAFVACTPDDYVAVVDLKSLEVTGHIAAGKGPDGLAWAVRGH
ncbi:MAG: YncE family protein [Acidobacteriota bacterium]|nr:YncE family protein [Acidobacteriota bacterium]